MIFAAFRLASSDIPAFDSALLLQPELNVLELSEYLPLLSKKYG
jgi:hypothetical protein